MTDDGAENRARNGSGGGQNRNGYERIEDLKATVLGGRRQSEDQPQHRTGPCAPGDAVEHSALMVGVCDLRDIPASRNMPDALRILPEHTVRCQSQA